MTDAAELSPEVRADARADRSAPLASIGVVLAIAGFALLVVEVVHTLTGGVLGTIGTILLWVGVGVLAVGLLLLVLSLTGDESADSSSGDSDEPVAAEPTIEYSPPPPPMPTAAPVTTPPPPAPVAPPPPAETQPAPAVPPPPVEATPVVEPPLPAPPPAVTPPAPAEPTPPVSEPGPAADEPSAG